MSRTEEITPWQGVVPTIRASQLDPVTEDDAVLLWVFHGRLTVDARERSFEATTGEGVWLPPGVHHSARLEPGSVAVPVIVEVDRLPTSLLQPGVVPVPPAWRDWLLYRTSRWFGFASGARPDRTRLVELLAEVVPAEQPSSVPRVPVLPPLPPLPRSRGPRSVIDKLLRHPAAADTLTELAAQAMISPRTLQRQLRAETGHNLVRWRTAIRVAAGAAHLVRGRDIGWTANRVGYAGVSGFTHAFTDRVGISPGRYAARHAETTTGDDPLIRELATLVGTRAAPEAPVIPAMPPSSSIARFDSALWVYRGTVTIEIAGSTRQLQAGDVFWLPHGASHQLEIAEGAIVLPLGSRATSRPARVVSLQVTRMPPVVELELFLLHTMVANHFLLRPPDHDDQAFLDLLRPPASPLPEVLAPHLEGIVTTSIHDPADRRTLTEWADELGMDLAVLRREFATAMGESFPRWRAKVRMTEARALLWDGHSPSTAARRLGYAHLPAFSKAFTASHGMPPREWLRREAG